MDSAPFAWAPLVMAAVAVALVLGGAALLALLFRPSGPAKVYVFRMAGIMLVAGGAVLAMSAWAMWSWGGEG